MWDPTQRRNSLPVNVIIYGLVLFNLSISVLMQSYFVLFIKIIYVNFLWRDAREVILVLCTTSSL